MNFKKSLIAHTIEKLLNAAPFGSVHASEHFFKLENEIFGFRIGSSLAYVAVD